MDIHGVRGRFVITVIVNVMKAGIAFITGIIIARSLGAEKYGEFNFLVRSFVSIFPLIDMGTSSAFYTFLSRKKRSSKFYSYYFLWLGIQLSVLLFIILLVIPNSMSLKIWLGEPRGMIAIAFMGSFFLHKVWDAVVHVGESIRKTIVVQIYNLILSVVYLCVLLVLILIKAINVQSILNSVIILYMAFSLFLWLKLARYIEYGDSIPFSDVIEKYKRYCKPLIFYNVAMFLYLFADVWLLQRFGGSFQQGIYSVSLRFSGVCLIIGTSALKIFWKEISEAHEKEDRDRLYYLFTKVSRNLFFVGALISCFFMIFSKEVLLISLGEGYSTGWICLSIMLLYPVHQILGQLYSAYYHATLNTKVFSILSISNMIVSIPLTYYILAPKTEIIPGLHMGAIGLALKMVILQIIQVNLLGYFISRYSKWKFEFFYQVKIIVLLLIGASFSKSVSAGALRHFDITSTIPLIFVSGFLYFFGAILFFRYIQGGIDKKLYLNNL